MIPKTTMNWETYTAFGDSITIGARTYFGYPELTGHQLSEQLKKQWNVINHAVSGYKAIDLARYIDLHFDTLRSHQSAISTILIGTNDVKAAVPLNDYLIALEQVIIKVKLITTSKNVVLIAIPHFHPGIMYPYSIEMNDQIREFNTGIAMLAKKHQVRTIAFEHSADDFVDGVHLNRKGIERFASQLSAFILKDRGISIE
jgi:lysophospholipase L1-like esterase